MKYFIAKKITPFCSVLLLSACMSNTSYKAKDNLLPENPSQPKFINKGGLTGKVISDKYKEGALVCFDDNKNGFCDITEASEKTYENGAFSFAKAISDKKLNAILIAQVPIAIKQDDGTNKWQQIVLSANQVNKGQSQIISPFTTLVVNEQLYNPFVNESQNDAISYLTATQLLDKSALEGEDFIASNNADNKKDATELVKVYTQAFSLKESDPFFVIANIIDEIVKAKTLTITINALKAQKRLDQSLSLASINKTSSWEKLYEDEVVLGSDFADDVKKVVIFSKWHNKLTVLDSSDIHSAPNVVGNEKFLFVDEPRDGIDANTGASEQDLAQIKVSNDGGTIYSMLTKAEDESKDIGVGVYISDISSVIPNTIFATEKNSAYFYKYEDITDISLSSDNSIFAVSGNDKKIMLFNAGDLSSSTHEIKTNKKVKSIAISENNSVIYAGLSKLRNNSFAIFDIASKSQVGEFPFVEYPTAILQKSENAIFVASNKSNKIFYLDISDKSNIKQIEVLTASAKVKKISFSRNGQYLIAALTTKQVNVFDLSNKSKIAMVRLDDIVVDAFDIGETNIAVVYGTNISYFNLREGGNLSEAEKKAWENEHRK